jgi:hypothetical protein
VARSIGVTEQGHIFVPAGITGNEGEVFLRSMYDGTRTYDYRNHKFVPADWMAKEFPDVRGLCEKMVMAAQSAISDDIDCNIPG